MNLLLDVMGHNTLCKRVHRSGVRVPAPLVCLDWPKYPPLVAQRHAAKVGRRVMGELKQLEGRLVDAGLMPDD